MKAFWKNPKGEYGYLARQKKLNILYTAIEFGISLLIYITGYVTTHSNKNLFTIIAILGCLPACKMLVSVIMYCRAKGCSAQSHEAIALHVHTLAQKYDLYLTSYQKNFQVSHMAIRSHNLIGLTEDPSFDEKACLDHLQSILKKNGYKDVSIHIYQKPKDYTGRIDELEKLPAKADEEGAQILHLMENISL